MRKLCSSCALIAIAALACPWVSLHAKEPAVPVSFVQEVMDDSLIDHVIMPRVNVAALLAEDANKAATARGIPYRVAEPLKSRITVKHHGTIETLDDGSRLWRVRVSSPGAKFLSFSFSGFRLARGAKLYFYSVERDFQIGPFTASRNNDLDVFGSPAIAGDSAVIELFLPADVEQWPAFVIDQVSYGYRDFLGFGRLSTRSASREIRTDKSTIPCQVNIVCAEGLDWQDDKDAVAKIYDGTYACSGTMIANQRHDCTNYFLTANHCVNKKRQAQRLTFYWNYEAYACGVSGGTTDHTSSGATIRATMAGADSRGGEGSDFTLLELNEAPDPGYHVYYAGYDRSTTPASGGTCIGHPLGFGKKIASESDPVEDGAGYEDGWGDSHWRVTAWDFGATEGGSSGSALWNPYHKIVGQLTGGDGECGGWSEFGKFSLSWVNGLSTYLDPDNTGVMSVGGHYATSVCYGGCSSNDDCDDSSECTTDVCNAGSCENWPLPDLIDCAGGKCCGGFCGPILCNSNDDCPVGDACTIGTCLNPTSCEAACQYTDEPDDTPCNVDRECCLGQCVSRECGPEDPCPPDGDPCTLDCVSFYQPGTGCEARSCEYTFDPTIPGCCGAKNDPCNSNADCCSGKCRRGSCR